VAQAAAGRAVEIFQACEVQRTLSKILRLMVCSYNLKLSVCNFKNYREIQKTHSWNVVYEPAFNLKMIVMILASGSLLGPEVPRNFVDQIFKFNSRPFETIAVGRRLGQAKQNSSTLQLDLAFVSLSVMVGARVVPRSYCTCSCEES
jgi:hypothetical protein